MTWTITFQIIVSYLHWRSIPWARKCSRIKSQGSRKADVYIPDKKANTVTEAILSNWVRLLLTSLVFGENYLSKAPGLSFVRGTSLDGK